MIRPADLIAPVQFAEKTTLDHPLEHLTACHRRIEERLATLERVIPHFIDKRDEAISAMESSLRFFDTNGSWHTADEEESLFPRIADRLTGDERGFIDKLEAEHQEAENIFTKLRAVAAKLKEDTPCSQERIDQYAALCRTLCTIYRGHIQAEDARIPEIGHRVLSEAELELISQEMKLRRGLQP
ncbi:MAG: hemerythrin domain-containing protein [Acidobacteria bacterium]|nr:hemerythrin domain-containing protein [Acidobacteriota bacterium]